MSPNLVDLTKCYGVFQALGYDLEQEMSKVAEQTAITKDSVDSMGDAADMAFMAEMSNAINKIPARGPVGHKGVQGSPGIDYDRLRPYSDYHYDRRSPERLLEEVAIAQARQTELLNHLLNQVVNLRQQVQSMQIELIEVRRELDASREREQAAAIKADPFVVSTRRRVRKPS